MSSKLEKALSNKRVLIRRAGTVAGEVTINFNSNSIKPVVLSHQGVIDLLSKRGVTSEAIRNSNLKKLIGEMLVDVIEA